MNKLFSTSLGVLLLGGIACAQGTFFIYGQGTSVGTVPNGSTPFTGGVSGAFPATNWLADDIALDPMYAGNSIRYIQFNVNNQYAAGATPILGLMMFTADGANVGPTGVNDPGTFTNLNRLGTPALPLGNTALTYGPAAGIYVVPTTGKVWIAMGADNNNNQAGRPLGADLNLFGLATVPSVAPFGGMAPATDAYYASTTAYLNNNGTAYTVPGSFSGAQAILGTGKTYDMAIGLRAQNYNFSATLGDVTALAYTKTINISVSAGNVNLANYYIVNYTNTTGATTALAIRCPNRLPIGASNPLTITLDGATFLKKKISVTLPDPPNDAPVAIVVPNVTLTNGDSDGSGEVDAADIDFVILKFGELPTSQTDPAANADVDCNGEVDAADIDIVIANFGALDD